MISVKKKLLDPTPSLIDFKNSDILTQFNKKRPYQTTVVDLIRDPSAPTPRKYFSIDPKKRPFQ